MTAGDRSPDRPARFPFVTAYAVVLWVASAWVVAFTGASAATAPRNASETPRHRRVLIVSVDGLRPDLILRAKAPTLAALMARGSFTLWATTTASSVTLPSHASMLTGVTPAHHGIEWNRDLPLSEPIYPSRPTLFEVAKAAGYTTAMAAGKSKFAALAKPGTLDWSFVPTTTLADTTVTDTAVRWIAKHAPDVLFVHLAGVDTAGHAEGWGSGAQLAAVQVADRSIARLLSALRDRRLLDLTTVLVTADHGGAGKTHGPDDPRSRTIPWIIAGPGIRKGFDLTQVPDLDVRTEDTFATLCYLLEVAPPQSVDGRAVTSILDTPHVRR